MPTDTVFLLAFVVAAFIVFALVVLWTNRQTGNLPKR
jgi:hypothetical protein